VITSSLRCWVSASMKFAPTSAVRWPVFAAPYRAFRQCRGVTAAGGERDLPAQQAGADLLEFIQRPGRRRGEQPGRRIQRAS
jgi:hypothetical protein